VPLVDLVCGSGVHGAQAVNMHLMQIHAPDLQHTIFGKFQDIHLKARVQPRLTLLRRVLKGHLRCFAVADPVSTGILT